MGSADPGPEHELQLTRGRYRWSWACSTCRWAGLDLPTAAAAEADHDAAAALAATLATTGPIPVPMPPLPSVRPPAEGPLRAGQQLPNEWTFCVQRAGDIWSAWAVGAAPSISAEGSTPPQALIALGGAFMVWLDGGGPETAPPTHAVLLGAQIAGAVLPDAVPIL
ncbi:hypothetical protein BBK14_01965 [Parafrankia soli]|uniref:Uncharacterized protein n=1 Tax=Parafrankia soli TaxID=2599596 RepID=A0A1S1RIK7_9ACTN|nr:hypothetical protein BBK14_01965 [Parafrankia soli]